MAEVTKVMASDGTIFDINDADDYTREEIDAMMVNKADVGLSYTKSEEEALLDQKANTSAVEAALANKANITSVYTKSETDTLLDDKADVGDSYTKAEEDVLLADKADVGVSYTKTEADALLADKADVNDVYNITQVDILLNAKADETDVYTKAEVDALLGGIKMMPLLDWSNPIWTAQSATDTFTATRKCYLYGWAQGGGNVEIRVNGGCVSIKTGINTADATATPYPIELVAGDVVTLANVTAYADNVRVYVERSV